MMWIVLSLVFATTGVLVAPAGSGVPAGIAHHRTVTGAPAAPAVLGVSLAAVIRGESVRGESVTVWPSAEPLQPFRALRGNPVHRSRTLLTVRTGWLGPLALAIRARSSNELGSARRSRVPFWAHAPPTQPRRVPHTAVASGPDDLVDARGASVAGRQPWERWTTILMEG